MSMKKVDVKFSNGLNVLACVRIANIASKFRSKLWLQKGDRIADIRSVVEMLSLGVYEGDSVNLLADGEDEGALLSALHNFFTDSETMDKISA